MKNIVLTGFMGTGKTVVGQGIAQRMGLPFVDMDAAIERWAGKPIVRIFAEDGEGKFREMESALCRRLSDRQGLVIATGGGTLVDSNNRALWARHDLMICLSCHPDEIVRRLRGTAHRPLLDVPDPRAEVERLLELRRDAYAAVPWQLDTTGLSPETVVTRVMELAAFRTLSVRHPAGEYDIHIGTGVMAHLSDVLHQVGAGRGNRVAIVSTPAIAALYGLPVDAGLRAGGFQPFACPIPDGERHKTLGTVSELYEQFLAGGLDRTGTVLALGGGVTGDVAGFAAATFMRGVGFVQVPTTLLAMVDASVGGKTGVDLLQGKNLVGAFKQPAAVIIDPTVLQTLPREELRSGLAEVIKHGIIGAPDLFSELSTDSGEFSGWWDQRGAARIAAALNVKIRIVEEDPFEQGRRAALNLGHTVGHALEQLSGFRMRHGEAVAIGMVAAARIAERLGRTTTAVADSIEALVTAWGLPACCPPFEFEAIWESMGYDKKRQGSSLRWVLPLSIGEVEIAADADPAVVRKVLCDLGARDEGWTAVRP